jgi:ComEC/Rec2-related protein
VVFERIGQMSGATSFIHVHVTLGIGLLTQQIDKYRDLLSTTFNSKEAILELFGIWLYALICGLSPSILRACVMFSFVIVGKQLSRSSNPFNSLSAAGFLLLAIKPYMLYNVGFQLSFAAVAGILGFYPFLNLLFQFKYTLFNEIWKIIVELKI